VHHAPPDGYGVSWTGKQFAGDAFLVSIINELGPQYVFSGHIHNSPFRNGGAWASLVGRTWTFNAGRQLGAPPSFIELDLASKKARWISQAGNEEISLELPAAG
jgi:Icc-related predicted phosphoesterase